MDELKLKQGLVATILPSRAAPSGQKHEDLRAAVHAAQVAYALKMATYTAAEEAGKAAAQATANVGRALEAAKLADAVEAEAWRAQGIAVTAWVAAQAAAWAAKDAATAK
jgi:hypothetical protein